MFSMQRKLNISIPKMIKNRLKFLYSILINSPNAQPIFSFNRIEQYIADRLDPINFCIKSFLERESIKIKPNEKVLDVGAGWCAYKQYFSHAKYESTDVSWNHPKLKCPHSFLANADNIPVKDNTYDVIVNTQVLEHVEYPQKVINEFFRILKPGGKLLLTAPQGWGIHMAPYHYYNFTIFGLRSLFKNSKFREISIETQGGIFWYLSNRMKTLPNYVREQYQINNLLFSLFANFFFIVTSSIFHILIPFLFFFLDYIDKKRDYTLGYNCVCMLSY